jgi:hypothetical protein
MPASARLHDRLPSAAAAIALQGGLLMLLVLSFDVVRRAVPERESFITLPPLARPRARRAPVVIDARPQTSTATPPPAPAQTVTPRFVPPTDLTLPAPPGNALSPAPGQAGADCGAPGAAGHNACPPAHAGAPPDEIPLHPESHVKNAPIWQSEIERRNTPPRVPCVSLTDNIVGIGGFQRQDHGARLDITCALKEWGNPSLLPPVSGSSVADPGPQHASDDAFNKALQAVKARKQALSGRAPAAAANAGAAP